MLKCPFLTLYVILTLFNRMKLIKNEVFSSFWIIWKNFSVHWYPSSTRQRSLTFPLWFLSSLLDYHSLLSVRWSWLPLFIDVFLWKRADTQRAALEKLTFVFVCVCVWQTVEEDCMYLQVLPLVGYRLKPSWKTWRWRRRWWWRSAQSQWKAGPSTQLSNTKHDIISHIHIKVEHNAQ